MAGVRDSRGLNLRLSIGWRQLLSNNANVSRARIASRNLVGPAAGAWEKGFMNDFDTGLDIDVADVVIRPPSLFLGGLAAGSILELIWPLGPGLAQGSWKPVVIGLFFAVCGGALAFRGVTGLRDAGTSFRFHEATNSVVSDGLYSFSRNPIYIGLIILYFGLALALTSGWALLLFPLCMTVLRRGVILREEAFMEGKFGEAYRAYKAKVPRWL